MVIRNDAIATKDEEKLDEVETSKQEDAVSPLHAMHDLQADYLLQYGGRMAYRPVERAQQMNYPQKIEKSKKKPIPLSIQWWKQKLVA